MVKRKAKQNDESILKDNINEDTIIECEVLQEFNDKYTKEKYKKGKKLKISYKRYNEIITKNENLIKLIEG
jgi:hypothetical protein